MTSTLDTKLQRFMRSDTVRAAQRADTQVLKIDEPAAMALLFSSFYMDFTVLLVGTFVTLYWYFTRKFDYWKKRNVPFIEPQAFFGNFKDSLLLRRGQNAVVQDLYYQLEDHSYGGIFQGPNPVLLLRDPDIIKIITVKDFSHFQDRGFSIDPKTNPLSQHLFFLGGSKWRYLRTKLSPTFTSGKMKTMFRVMEECSKYLQQYLEEPASKGEILELKDVLAKFSTDVIGTCAFGLQMNALKNPDSEFRKMGKRVFESNFANAAKRFCIAIFPKLASLLRVPVLNAEVKDFFMSVVNETVEYREQKNIKRNDFLQLLIQLKNQGKIEDDEDDKENQDDVNIYSKDSKKQYDDNFEMDNALIAAQAFVFFLAGFETSSTTMSFALHELAVNPYIQEKLREEIDATLQETDGMFTYDAIMGMKYLDKVVSETLRKYPPVGLLLRHVTIPYTIPGTDVHLDSGTKVFIPTFALHRDPKYFPEPERFDPERFSEEGKASRPQYVYLPFGEGPRNCIGMRFGLLQTKMGLAALLSKYEFHVCERTEVPLRFDPKSAVTASVTGTILRVTQRT